MYRTNARDPERPPVRPFNWMLLNRATAAVLLVVGLVLAVTFAGCPMPAPDGCTPLDRRCHEDTPQVCSPGQRWTPADVRCGTVGASCVVTDGGAPACLAGGAQ